MGGNSAQRLSGLARRVLDRLRLVEHHRRPPGIGQGVDVAHRRGVGRDHDVRVGDLLLELRVGGTRRSVMHEHTQVGCEPGGLSRPVADHRGRSDDQRGTPASGAGEVGEHGRCLPQPHVERETSAEFVDGEKVDPRQRLCLIGPQCPDEAVGGDVERDLRLMGTVDELLGPTVAVNDDPDSVHRSIETNALAEDLGAGQLRDRFAFGQRSSCPFQIESIDCHPPTV